MNATDLLAQLTTTREADQRTRLDMSTATNGRARDHGWLQIMRAAGSKGPADLAMLHPLLGLAWVQVGTAKSKTLSPLDRDRLVAVAEQTHALPLLATSGPGIPTRFYVVTRGTASTWAEWSITPRRQPHDLTSRQGQTHPTV